MSALPTLPPARATGALLCGFAASAALAGVIPGTGASPSSTQLGATDAVAMQRAPDQKGHVLLVPYFTAQQGQMTVLHLANTDRNNGKAIKLRIRGAANGDSLLTLTVLLSPGDMWTGAVTAGPDGRAQIVTGDASCTAPRLAAGVAQPFSTDRLNPALTQEERASHTREGAIEAIVAADIPFAPLYGATGTAYSELRAAISPALVPPRCSAPAVDAALLEDASDEATAAARGFATPSGGVGGTWYIIDVPGATTFSSAMTALQAINAAGRPARGNYVLFPATDQAIAQPERYTADPLLVSAGLASRQKSIDGVASEPTSSAVVQALAHDLPDLSTPYRLPASEANARRTAAEASQALAAHEVSNQFSVESSISAQTDWVLAMPTQRYSVALDYATGQRTFSVVPPAGEGRQYYHTDNTQARAGRVCRFNVNTTLHVSSREDLRDRVGTGALFPTPLSLQLCGAVTVAPAAQIASASPSVLSASAALSSPLQTQSAVTGWAALEFLDPTGQPVIGAAFMKLVNPGAAPGLAGHYGILYPHMVTQP